MSRTSVCLKDNTSIHCDEVQFETVVLYFWGTAEYLNAVVFGKSLINQEISVQFIKAKSINSYKPAHFTQQQAQNGP